MKQKDISVSRVLMEESLIPRKFWRMGADTYKGAKMPLQKVCKYLDHYPKKPNGVGLVLYGRARSGKTFLLTFALKCLMAQGFSARYFTLEDLLQESLHTPGFSDVLRSTAFIGIDSVNVLTGESEKAAQFTQRILKRTLDLRLNHGLPSFLATTFDPSTWAVFGEVESDLRHDFIAVECSLSRHVTSHEADRRKSGLELFEKGL